MPSIYFTDALLNILMCEYNCIKFRLVQVCIFFSVHIVQIQSEAKIHQYSMRVF